MDHYKHDEQEVDDNDLEEGSEVLDFENLVGGMESVESEEDAAKRKNELAARLDQFGASLAKTRSDAINARQQSGIEDEWIEDEEFYQGVDDANRSEAKATWRTKPMGQTSSRPPTGGTRSTVFPNITRPYCDAAAARIADMLLPTDDRSWGIKPTPIPELQQKIDDYDDEKKQAAPVAPVPAPKIASTSAPVAPGGPQPQGLIPGAQPAPPMPEAAPEQPELPKTERDLEIEEAKKVMKVAMDKADKTQTRIEDWHVECQWHAHVRTVIEDSSRAGTGVLKGPIPMLKKGFQYKDEVTPSADNPKGSVAGVSKTEKINPGSKWVDFWNIYPDGACGDNIHNGSYIWERDYLTRKQLRELMGREDYIDDQIEMCLKEGPQRAEATYKDTPDGNVDSLLGKDKFEIWFFHGTAEREDLEALGCECGNEGDPYVPVVLEMVNNRVIKVVMNPLDTGEFPYDVMVWQKRSGYWAGIGVARQIRTPQRIVTAATRALMDNAGLASGPMIIFRQAVVTPADGNYILAPRKIWYIAENATDMKDARHAIGVVKVDMLVTELTAIVNLGLSMAEDVTGMPMLMQGQMGNKTPDTLGGMQMLNNNSSAVLRRLARLFDDRVTEPHVRRYYHWHMQYGPDEEKGDYCVDARGSSALVERDLQNQVIGQTAQLFLDPRYGKDPKKWMDEFLKSQRLDVNRFNYDDEEWKKVVEKMSQPPPNPAVEVATINAENRITLQQANDALQKTLAQAETAAVAQENGLDRQLQIMIKTAEESGKRVLSLDDVKKVVGVTVMKIKAQQESEQRGRQHQSQEGDKDKFHSSRESEKGHAAKLASDAIKGFEPAGKAPKGQSYTK